MAYLFDTDAISEVLKKKPAPYMQWLQAIPPEQQYVSVIIL
jgi:tRNA(fMet)-specific endonuclease VapC